MTAAVFSPGRTVLIALNTLREAVRQRVFVFLVLLALAVIWGAQYLRDFHFGSSELKFIADLGLGAMAAIGTVLAVVLTAQVFFSEVERRTVLTLLAKPVGRAEFILGKFGGVAVVVGAFCGLLTVVLIGVVWARETSLLREGPEGFAGGRVVNLAHLAMGAWLQWLKLMVLAALTLLVASYARTPLFTIVMGFLVFVGCHLQALAHAPGNRAGLSTASAIMALVGRVLPNFQLFALADAAEANAPLPWSHVGQLALYASAYIAAACGLAVFSFCRREF